ncbi:hypothetical protein [Streptomyces sp. NBC_00503]|uniref:hypothetical protein n=1 Tax=Streptomyces sp. NBC_00503 TaxID=2903659 RepID=UPI002E8148B8|nr:hypothetical protein [Streptomyces sp. NBC_00503]WUD82603.1 hypothetical protein OG490_19800 [Streptomyces sp. NBC_00503]
MGWTFKLHGGIATALGTALLVLAALTWIPGSLPMSASRWLVPVIVVLFFPIFISAWVRMLLTRADRHSMWLAFRCLSGRVQLVLATLAVAGVAMIIISLAVERNLQSAEVKDGRYFAFDTTPYARGPVEVTQDQYEAVLESDQRSMFAIPGVLFVVAATFVMASGEIRRSDRGFVPSRP